MFWQWSGCCCRSSDPGCSNWGHHGEGEEVPYGHLCPAWPSVLSKISPTPPNAKHCSSCFLPETGGNGRKKTSWVMLGSGLGSTGGWRQHPDRACGHSHPVCHPLSPFRSCQCASDYIQLINSRLRFWNQNCAGGGTWNSVFPRCWSSSDSTRACVCWVRGGWLRRCAGSSWSAVLAPRNLNTQIWCSQAGTLCPCSTFSSRIGA